MSGSVDWILGSVGPYGQASVEYSNATRPWGRAWRATDRAAFEHKTDSIHADVDDILRVPPTPETFTVARSEKCSGFVAEMRLELSEELRRDEFVGVLH